MDRLHILTSTGRFSSFDQLRRYIDMTYTDDGDGLASEFIREVQLVNYEPGCIEAVISRSGRPVPLAELLGSASWAGQWLSLLPAAALADAAVCVYPPNRMLSPRACSLQYIGEFPYEVVRG